MAKRKSTLGRMVDSFTAQIDRQTALMDKCSKRGFHRWQDSNAVYHGEPQEQCRDCSVYRSKDLSKD